MQDAKQRVFTSIDVTLEEQSDAWYGQGLMGTFLGPRDAAFAVLESTDPGSDNIAVYAAPAVYTAPAAAGGEGGPPEPAVRAYCELGLGDAVKGLWAGPPCTFALEEAEYDTEGNVVEREEVQVRFRYWYDLDITKFEVLGR